MFYMNRFHASLGLRPADANKRYPDRNCLNQRTSNSVIQRNFDGKPNRILQTNLSAAWVCLIFFTGALSLCANAQDFRFHIEPSQRFFDTDDYTGKYMEKNSFTDPPDLYAGQKETGRRENLNFIAVVGHLFNRSLVEELRSLDPKLISEGDVVQVHFPESYIPESQWLLCRDSSSLLQGVPLPMHEGSHSFYVMVTHNSPSLPTTTLPCTVNVLTEEDALEFRLKHADHPDVVHLGETNHCPHYEPLTVASVTLNADPRVMSKNERVDCLQAVSTAMVIPSERIVIHTTAASLKNDRPFLSGPGNVPKVRTHRGDRDLTGSVIMTWLVGCSSDITGTIPGLEKLENMAKDGSLAQATGYDVSEWQIVNRIRHFEKLKRTRRQAYQGSVVASANIYYPKASKLSLTADNIRAIPGMETEETVAYLTRGRTRINLNSVRATPMAGIPVMASKVTDLLLDRSAHVVPPSTPTIPMPAKSAEPEIKPEVNHAPMTLFGMPDVHARVGVYTAFWIPNDAFLDSEEGNTPNLNLKIMDTVTHKNVPNSGSWPRFDTEAQLLYGVPPDDAEEKRKYLVVATDSGGKSSTFPISIFVDKEKLAPRTHKFTINFMETDETRDMTPGAIFSSFGRKLAVALAKTEDVPGELTMLKTGLLKGKDQRFVSWFDNSFNGKTHCPTEAIAKAANLMAGQDATEGRNKPVREFSAKFRPEYKLKVVKIELLGPCIEAKTTTTTTTTTTSTITPERPTTLTTTSIPTIKTISPTTVFPRTAPKGGIPHVAKPLPALGTKVGKVLEFKLPLGTFKDPEDPELELKTDLLGSVPAWVGFEPKTRTLYIMPTTTDLDSMSPYNSTHSMWKGALCARDKDGNDSPSLSLEVLVERTETKMNNANHRFEVGIKNYNIKNFTSNDRMRLIRLICDIFGDKDSKHIYLQSVRQGSVIVTWYNSTLGHIDPCPYDDIAILAKMLFVKEGIDPDIIARFKETNFILGTLNVSKPLSCKRKVVPPPTIPDSRTTEPVGVAGASSKTTSILIIAVVVVCLVLLIVILVVKCRMGKKARKKERAKREQKEKEDAALVGSPHKIKKGRPIIFEDEIAMGTNGSANATPATPLIGSPSQATPYRGNGNAGTSAATADNDDIREETTFAQPHTHHPMTPPTPVMCERPPPPYTSPH